MRLQICRACLVPLCDNTSHDGSTDKRFLVVVVHPPYYIVERDVVPLILMPTCEGIYVKLDCQEHSGTKYPPDPSNI